jgi:AcrR family transcriptional regulator
MDQRVQKLPWHMVNATDKGLATRERIVTGAAEVMREAGAAHVTLDDIRARSRTSKSQLFHYFPGGREELLLAVARHEATRVIDDQQPFLGYLTTWEEWDLWREAVVERYRQQGPTCPLHMLMSQLDRTTPGAQAVVAELMRNWHQPLHAGITAMQGAGLIRARVNANDAARALVATIQGGVQVLLSTGTTQHLEAGLDLVLDYLRVPDADIGMR